MLGPPWRADVPVTIAGLQADPVHRREVADGIALMRVHHELGLGGRARREIQQHRIAGARRRRSAMNAASACRRRIVSMPLCRRVADRDSGERAGHAGELRHVGRAR